MLNDDHSSDEETSSSARRVRALRFVKAGCLGTLLTFMVLSAGSLVYFFSQEHTPSLSAKLADAEPEERLRVLLQTERSGAQKHVAKWGADERRRWQDIVREQALFLPAKYQRLCADIRFLAKASLWPEELQPAIKACRERARAQKELNAVERENNLSVPVAWSSTSARSSSERTPTNA